MAVGIGVFLPVAETARRINQIAELKEVPAWIDDYVLGAILVGGGYSILQRKAANHGYLIAAWGIGVGALFLSFLGQFEYFVTEEGDPGIFSTTLVAVVKGLILAVMLTGLNWSIRAVKQ